MPSDGMAEMATPASWSAVLVAFVVTLAVGGARCGAASQAPETAPALAWEATGFTAPESIVFDAGRGQFYVPRCTDTGEAPGDQGARSENMGDIRTTSNAERRDASPVECSGTSTTGC